MYKVVMGVLVLAAPTGCAGSKMNEARSGAPYKTLASDKATLVVAECIQFGWQDESAFGVDAGGFKEPNGAGGFTVYTTGWRLSSSTCKVRVPDRPSNTTPPRMRCPPSVVWPRWRLVCSPLP